MTKKQLATLKETLLVLRSEFYRSAAQYAREAGVARASGVIGFPLKDVAAMAAADPSELEKMARSTFQKMVINPPIYEVLDGPEVRQRVMIEEIRSLEAMLQN